jgi:type IV pilus assembly protein PilB
MVQATEGEMTKESNDLRWSRLIDGVAARVRFADPRVVAALRELGDQRVADLAGWSASIDSALPQLGDRPPMPIGAALAIVSALRLRPNANVLQIGFGNELVTELTASIAGRLNVVEIDPTKAETQLAWLNRPNVAWRAGDGSEGWPEAGPFDAIVVSASHFDLPNDLFAQLKPGGRLITLVGASRTQQTIVAVKTDENGNFVEEQLGSVGMYAMFGEIAVLIGAAHQADIKAAYDEAAASSRRLSDVLAERGVLDEHERVRILALQHSARVSTVDELMARADLASVANVPRGYVETSKVVPLAVVNGVLLAATTEPDINVDELQKALRVHRTELHFVTATDFRRIIASIDLGPSALPADYTANAEDAAEPLEGAGESDTRFVSLFETIVLDAVGERASDIHLERYGDRVRLRVRVDGDLRDISRIALLPEELIGVVNVIKINANLDISERRRPQGGRMRRRVGDLVFDMRVQTQPSLHGEHVVIRLLQNNMRQIGIDDIGLMPAVANSYRRLLDAPAGLVLVVGPTGSGKTTTLYAGLQLLAADQTRKVIAAEDPIEYAIPNVQQTATRADLGFDFADAMRSFVREDPDVIFVGEIRDHDTALEALRASQTGHLVLSTLHCNDAVDAVQRLRDLGMHPNSISAELLAVVAQRLAKRICSGCIAEVAPDPAILAEVFPDGPPAGFRTFKGKGCIRCSGRGTHGRIAIAEFVQARSAFRRGITRELSNDELRELALDEGLITMREAALDAVARGVISFDEMPKILLPERMAPEKRTRK